MADRQRCTTLMIMLTPEEKARIREAAAERGMTMSTYARIALLGMGEAKPQRP